MQGEVVDVDVDERVVELADESTVDYDYVLVAIGSETATYGIDGMAEHPLTLKSREDALEIHEQVREAARDATRDDPAQVVIGGAGLSGIQSAGEVAEFRDENHAPIDVTLVEALPEIFPPGNAEIQARCATDSNSVTSTLSRTTRSRPRRPTTSSSTSATTSTTTSSSGRAASPVRRNSPTSISRRSTTA